MSIIKKIWNFIWKSNSLLSWIINIILAFLLVKFVIYPLIGLIFSTSFPIVAVVSGSMEHDTNFDIWWASQSKWHSNYNRTLEEARDLPFANGFNKGDIMILRGVKPEKINVGDVIVFKSNSKNPIIHRVIQKWKDSNTYYFQTKGDHNSDSFEAIGETRIPEENVLGKAILRIPMLGWIKIFFTELTGL